MAQQNQAVGVKKVIKVAFTDDKSCRHYSYLTDDMGIKDGDFVLVAVGDDAKPDTLVPKAAKVVAAAGLSKAECDMANKWIVGPIDLTEYRRRAAVQVRVQEIKNQLRQAREETEEFLIYKQLADSNPAIKQLLGELAQLDPSMVPALPASTDTKDAE